MPGSVLRGSSGEGDEDIAVRGCRHKVLEYLGRGSRTADQDREEDLNSLIGAAGPGASELG
jgi:hypothetical protein